MYIPRSIAQEERKMHGASAKVIPKVNYTHLCKIDFRGVTRDLKARGNLCTTPVKICANGTRAGRLNLSN